MTEKMHDQKSKTKASVFMEGMAQFSLMKRTNATTLCAFAAACGCGILMGILLFLFVGIPADIAGVKALYLSARALSAYDTPRAYLAFYTGWFSKSCLWLLAAALCGMTVRPRVFSSALCFTRALIAGFGIASISGRFSAFLVFYAIMQSAFLVWLMLACCKCCRYADRRAYVVMTRSGDAIYTRRFLENSVLPLAANLLLSAFALAIGLFTLSAIADLFI